MQFDRLHSILDSSALANYFKFCHLQPNFENLNRNFSKNLNRNFSENLNRNFSENLNRNFGHLLGSFNTNASPISISTCSAPTESTPTPYWTPSFFSGLFSIY